MAVDAPETDYESAVNETGALLTDVYGFPPAGAELCPREGADRI